MSHGQFLVLGRLSQTFKNYIILQDNPTRNSSWNEKQTVPTAALRYNMMTLTYSSFAVETQVPVGGSDHHRHTFAVTVKDAEG